MKRIKYLITIFTLAIVTLIACACGQTPATYSVTLPETPVGYTVSGNASVTEGATYTFTVEIANGYEKSTDFAVKVNGNEVTSATDTYTVENVSANLTVTVEGVVAETYAVTLANGEGYTVSGNATATYGSDYTFTVVIANDYEKSSAFVVKVNGNEVTSATNTYTVENVSGELVITVSGVVNSNDTNLGGNENENEDQWWNN